MARTWSVGTKGDPQMFISQFYSMYYLTHMFKIVGTTHSPRSRLQIWFETTKDNVLSEKLCKWAGEDGPAGEVSASKESMSRKWANLRSFSQNQTTLNILHFDLMLEFWTDFLWFWIWSNCLFRFWTWHHQNSPKNLRRLGYKLFFFADIAAFRNISISGYFSIKTCIFNQLQNLLTNPTVRKKPAVGWRPHNQWALLWMIPWRCFPNFLWANDLGLYMFNRLFF